MHVILFAYYTIYLKNILFINGAPGCKLTYGVYLQLLPLALIHGMEYCSLLINY